MNPIPNSESISPSQARATVHAISSKRDSPVLEGRTLIVITHRTSLLDLVDRVIVIDGGKVVADGPKGQFIRRQATGGGA